MRKTKAQLVQELQELRRQVAKSRTKREDQQAADSSVAGLDLLQALMDHLPDYVFFKDRDSRFIRANRAHVAMLGCTDPETVIGKTDFAFFSQKDAQRFYDEEQAIMTSGEPVIGREWTYVTGDGKKLWVSEHKVPMIDDKGQVVGLISISSDITEHKRAEETLTEERNLLRTLIDNVPDYVYFKDTESRFIFNNVAHLTSLGKEKQEDVIGKTDLDIFQRELALEYYDTEQELIKTGRSLINHEEPIVDPSTGERRWASSTKVPIRDSSGQIMGLVGVTRDINERRLMEEALQKANEDLEQYTATLERRAVQLQAASEVAREATAILDVPRLLGQTVQLISDRFGFYHAGVFLVDEQNEYAILRAASSEGGRHMLERGHRLPIGEMGIVGHVTATGEPRIALDVGEDAEFFENPDLPDTRSEMALPLRVRDRIIGALDVQSTKPAAFTAEDMTILQTLTDQLAIAIENARLVERTEAQLNELNRLYGEYSAASWAALATTEQARGYVYDQVDVRPIAQAPVPGLGAALEEGKPITIVDPETQGSVLAVPLKMRGQVIGTLGLQESGDSREWSPEEITLIEQVADQVVQALDNARLFAETRRTAQSMEALYETSRALSSSIEEKALMQAFLQAVYDSLGCEHALISLVDEAAGTVGVKHGIWQGEFDVFPEWIERSQFPLSQPDILTEVYRTGHTEIINGWDERLNREIYEQYGHERFLRVFMPIKLRDRVLGIIEVAYDRRKKSHIGEEEVQMLAAFIDQVAVALENARMFEETQRRAQHEHQIYEIAAKLRRSPDIATILQTAVDELGQALRADRALVRLRVKTGERDAGELGSARPEPPRSQTGEF